ncbi:unnamed protein product [Rhizophagus irregularis]|nr:unnamed protein product [Rhizophagus irregularis]
MECLYQYAVEHGLDPEKFLIVTETDKKRWTGESFHDREKMIGEELLRHDILKHQSSTAWLDDLMKEWEKPHTQFIQVFGQALYQNSIPIVSVKA